MSAGLQKSDVSLMEVNGRNVGEGMIEEVRAQVPSPYHEDLLCVGDRSDLLPVVVRHDVLALRAIHQTELKTGVGVRDECDTGRVG